MTHDTGTGTGDEYIWSDVYDYACKAFGQTPRPEDEAIIIEHFERNPLQVIREIDRIATALNEGRIRYAWSAFAGRIKQEPHEPLREAIADASAERDRRVRAAEQWIRNAGLHYDRESDIEAELFGDDYTKGRLHDYRNDQALRTRLLDHWRTHRPRGEQAERDHEAWAKHCVESRARVNAMLKAKHQPEPEPDDEPTFTPAAT